MQLLHRRRGKERAKASGFEGGGRTKKHGLRCDGPALRTSPVRRGGGGRQAGQEHSNGEQGDDGRTSHPARRGGLADAAANTRKAREEMEEQESGLSAPKPSLLSAAELVSPVWWCGGSNENREAHRVAGSRRQVLCSPIRATVTCRGYTWRASGALIAPGGLSCCAVAGSAVCGGPRSRDGGGAARGFLALAASERRAAVLSRLADVKDSWWSEPAVGRFYSFATAWILFRLGNGRETQRFELENVFNLFFTLTQSGT